MDTVRSVHSFLAYWYLQYELNTSLYMLEPAEKVIINTVAVAIFGLLSFAAVTYLPGHVIMMLNFLFRCFYSDNENSNGVS